MFDGLEREGEERENQNCKEKIKKSLKYKQKYTENMKLRVSHIFSVVIPSFYTIDLYQCDM